jgi:antitoxin MazE
MLTKRLTKHGNSLALVIDKPILDLLGIDGETELAITTQGKSLVITEAPDADRKARFDAALAKVNKHYGHALQRLAE